jgi:UDP-3-O-[3-hydroxymyristoyl] N-acetylglucosamine deacetylase
LKKKIELKGIGLHSGRPATLTVLPAEGHTGVVFRRTDLAHAEPIKATVTNICSTDLSTSIGNGQNKVATIEHLMAAFAGLGIDNALVLVDGPEVPIMDGSSAPFVDALLAAGIAKIPGHRRLFVVKDAFEIKDGDKLMRVEPADRLEFSCVVDYKSGAIGRQALDFTFSRANFLDLCESRTFCHFKEVEAMRAHGLALGGSLDNAIVVTDTEVMNPGGLRYADEFVRHKLLDCIGDLALLGAPLVGKITLHKAGHALHAKFVTELMRRKAELLSVVETGSFRDRRPAVAEALAGNSHGLRQPR